MRYMTSGANLLVQADINGDGIADMEVVLAGLAGQVLTGAISCSRPPPNRAANAMSRALLVA